MGLRLLRFVSKTTSYDNGSPETPTSSVRLRKHSPLSQRARIHHAVFHDLEQVNPRAADAIADMTLGVLERSRIMRGDEE